MGLGSALKIIICPSPLFLCFLRCTHGWRLGRLDEAGRVFKRILWANPAGGFGFHRWEEGKETLGGPWKRVRIRGAPRAPGSIPLTIIWWSAPGRFIRAFLGMVQTYQIHLPI